MQLGDAMKNHLLQLKAVLQSPIVELDPENQSTASIIASHLLSHPTNCCIVVATTTSSNKLQNIKNLYRSMALLKRLQRQFSKEHRTLHTSLIGIYPALEYPACVYELNTAADHYVSDSVLPFGSSTLICAVKKLISITLGVSPAVGGVGLILYKE